MAAARNSFAHIFYRQRIQNNNLKYKCECQQEKNNNLFCNYTLTDCSAAKKNHRHTIHVRNALLSVHEDCLPRNNFTSNEVAAIQCVFFAQSFFHLSPLALTLHKRNALQIHFQLNFLPRIHWEQERLKLFIFIGNFVSIFALHFFMSFEFFFQFHISIQFAPLFKIIPFYNHSRRTFYAFHCLLNYAFYQLFFLSPIVASMVCFVLLFPNL